MKKDAHESPRLSAVVASALFFVSVQTVAAAQADETAAVAPAGAAAAAAAAADPAAPPPEDEQGEVVDAQRGAAPQLTTGDAGEEAPGAAADDAADAGPPQPGAAEIPVAATPEGVQRLIDAKQYDQAAELARDLLTRNEVRYGADSPKNIELLRALAHAQAGQDDISRSTASLEKLIELIETRDGIFGESLVEPLKNLGALLQREDRLEDALSALIRARHITHRRFGVVNGEQLTIVDMLTELHIARGEFSDANREQKLAFRIANSNCDDDAACKVAGLYKLARWYQRTRRFTLSRGYYKDALKILEQAYGEDDPSLVDALHGVAQTYVDQGYRQGDGRRALERAALILDSQPFVDMVEHVQSHMKLGDWYNLNNDHDNARAAYMRAWSVMKDNGVDDETSDLAFARPVELRYRPPVPAAGDPAWHQSKLRDAHVTVEFDVNENGRVENARVIDSNVSARVRKEVRDSVRSAKYRPKLLNGGPVRAEGVRFIQNFDYVVRYQRERARRAASRRAGRQNCVGGGCVSSAPIGNDREVPRGGMRDMHPDDETQTSMPVDGSVDHDQRGDRLDAGSRPGSNGAGIGEELP